MSKHTPGPWTVIPPGHGSETEYLCVQIGEDDSYTTLEVLPADARLIAAAPDLLEASRAGAALCQRFLTDEEITVTPEEIGDVLDLLRAALAKARGEEE